MAKRVLILYYSWSGNTRKVAQKINREIPNSDLKEIKVADNTFAADMYKTNDIALDQIQNNQYPEAQIGQINFNNYDLILIGSPIWSGYPATPLKSVLQAMKSYQGQVASFFTSAGANQKAYVNHFKEWANGLNVIGVASEDSQIKNWLK